MRQSGHLLDILVAIVLSIGASAHKVTGNEACAALAASKLALYSLEKQRIYKKRNSTYEFVAFPVK